MRDIAVTYLKRILTPVGYVVAGEQRGAIVSLLLPGETGPAPEREGSTPLLEECARQLSRYFAGDLHAFDLPLSPEGTPFQRAVWDRLLDIQYGQTRTYAQIAREIGVPGAARAVGAANHVNPIPILIPCHRVVGANGQMRGYRGGMAMKEYLLSLENRAGENTLETR